MTMPNSDRSARAARRQKERDMGKRNRPGRANAPQVQDLLVEGFTATVKQNQNITALLEVIARQNAGQSMEDITRTTGISFPIVTQEELEKSIAEEMEKELARLEDEAGGPDEPTTLEEVIAEATSLGEPEDNGELAGQVSIDEALADPSMD